MTPKIKWLLPCALLLHSCIEDVGSYSYRTITRIDSITGISSVDHVYEVAIGDSLHIVPTLGISFGESGANDTFAYAWHVLGTAAPFQSVGVVSRQRELHIVVGGLLDAPRTYDMMFCATNTTTGVRYDHVFSVEVMSSQRDVGYLILHEQADSFDLDLIAVFGSMYTRYQNVLTNSGSALPKAGRRPLDLHCFPDELAPAIGEAGKHYAVWILTDQSADRIKTEDFSYLPSYSISRLVMNTRFIPNSAAFVPQKTYAPNFNATGQMGRLYAFWNGDLYFYNASRAVCFFDTPLNTLADTSTTTYPIAPYIFANPIGAILFNEQTRGFMFHKGDATSLNMNTNNLHHATALTAYDQATGMPWSDPGYRLVYMGYRDGVSSGFAIVEHTTNSGISYQLWLLGITFSATNPTPSQQGVQTFSTYPFAGGITMDDIKFFAFHGTRPFLYMATDERVLCVNTTTMGVTDITAQLITPPFGKISLMRTRSLRLPVGSGTDGLALGTYDPLQPNSVNGRLTIYSVNDEGALVKAFHTQSDGSAFMLDFVNLGKVVAVDYRSPL
ncbi:MAG: hypothetical protein LBS94_04975 [Prevotellaceae bacterium]|jgi:hypothetical protein|nr:hypothetical protein [Prevotellaceae bacterium]